MDTSKAQLEQKKLKGVLLDASLELRIVNLFIKQEYYLNILREFFVKTEGSTCCMDKARFVFKLYLAHLIENKPFEYVPGSDFYVPEIEPEKVFRVIELLTRNDIQLLVEKLVELVNEGKPQPVPMGTIKSAWKRRLKLKAALVYIADFMLNRMEDAPARFVLMSVLYLLHSQYGFRYTSFTSSFYGPYSRGADIAFDELRSEAFVVENEKAEDGSACRMVVKRMLPKSESYISVLDRAEKERLDEALVDIYTRFADRNGRLLLDRILEEIYDRDEAYARAGFGEKIDFSSSSKGL